MEKKIIEYGTTHEVTVIESNNKVVIVVDENNEGYILMGHGINPLPKVNDKGQITFIKSNTPFNGHWHFDNYESIQTLGSNR